MTYTNFTQKTCYNVSHIGQYSFGSFKYCPFFVPKNPSILISPFQNNGLETAVVVVERQAEGWRDYDCIARGKATPGHVESDHKKQWGMLPLNSIDRV